jgi:hypothetical protein
MWVILGINVGKYSMDGACDMGFICLLKYENH